jgi:hypothetical protein
MRAFSARFVRGSLFTAGGFALLAGLIACSQKDDSQEGAISSGSGTGAAAGTGASGGTSSGTGSSSGSGSGSGTSAGGSITIGGSGGTGGVVPDAGCASHTEAAKIQPVHLVILMDRSGSMVGADIGEDLQAVKWDPLVTALKGFFTDPTSSGLSASMIMFPAESGFGNTTACAVEDYATAGVATTPLPSPAFGAALDMTTPPNGFGTPTYPALAGAIAYARAQEALTPDQKLVILMVTDGVPDECDDEGNTIEAAAAEAAAVAAEIPTYVIGVGDSLDNLNAIAEAGGTSAAILVSIDDPAKTQADITTAINQIRGKEIACNISLPVPTGGDMIDPFKVNVSFTPSTGVPEVLTYDQSCAAGGWRYDDPVNPTAIVLCETTCGAVTADQATELNIILGCATAVPA